MDLRPALKTFSESFFTPVLGIYRACSVKGGISGA